MKIATFSIVAGSKACNARCPFCVARMTGLELDGKEPPVNWRNFYKACQLAKDKGVTTVLITGKGEPTLFPDQLTKFLDELQQFNFPFIELQTNGSRIADGACDRYIDTWYNMGLTTVAVSIVHYKEGANHEIYQLPGNRHFNLAKLIVKLHEHKFSVRLTAMLLKGFIDNTEDLKKMIKYAAEFGVEQLTLRPIRKPANSEDMGATAFVEERGLSTEDEAGARGWLDRNATLLMTLAHNARVYDYEGQNVCLSDCLTLHPETDDLRQLIFFPDGHLRYDWQYKGAILL